MACKNNNEDLNNNKTDTFQEKNAKNFSRQVNIFKDRKVNLLPEAEESSANWMAFTTAKNEIERIDNFTLQEVVNNSNNLFKSIQGLQDSIPTEFQKRTIKARLNVLLTKAYLLEGEASKQTPSAKQIDTLSANLYKEFENLKIQLNEVFRKSIEDFEFELDERVRIQDSLSSSKKNSLPKLKAKR
ncbi:hypothetical protein [Mesonia aestuariivivens]|uniref:Lipoprotein n=1 Tax=Mesonia aestuariivivens TaxID=2796128 RepID=A0ABS6W228_9FLAO|nr:hypothetical protein [Mesonia aestuariivivens]MBW2961911.1 hypothetical protein [Mesonia aestuariivivens]